MYVNYSGWNERVGRFSHDIYIDENRTDYEIIFKNGTSAKQVSPFQVEGADWNNDGDYYEMFGAYFNHGSRNEFWTPEEMVTALMEGREGRPPMSGVAVKDIPGIKLPKALEKKPSLDERLRASEVKTKKSAGAEVSFKGFKVR